MASVISAPARVDEAEGVPLLRAGKRPRPGVAASANTMQGRPFFDEHKWALLEREQELERRRAEEAIRRLHAIEELRRRARERRHDRNRRRLEFAVKLELCVLTLQRHERGRQARKVATRRALAAAKIIKWFQVKMRRAALLKAVRNRAILRMMVSVEQFVEEQLSEARFFVQNVVALRAFQTHRSARIIQKAERRRAELARRSAAVIVRATRCWLARGSLRRVRIRRGIRRFRGSLSRRKLGLKEPDPFAVPVMRDFPTEGRWWDTGAPAVPRPKWGTLRVEHEEARSRQRALSLADLIRSGQPKIDTPAPAAAAAAAAAAAGRVQSERGRHARTGEAFSVRAKRWGNKGGDSAAGKETSRGGENDGAGPRAGGESTEITVGFGKRVTTRRAASMIDPREAEKAALVSELERRHARRRAVAPDYDKLSLVEKHLRREREFQEQRDKRRAAAERQALRKERQRAREIAEAARQKALEAELLEKKEEEKARKRLEKIREYKEKKAARELAARKALAAQREEERRAKADEEAERVAIEAAFEKEKAERLERARRTRRAEEQQQGRKRKDGQGGADRSHNKLSATAAPGRHRTKRHAGTSKKKSRAALAPIAVTNNGRDDGRKRVRRAARLSRAGGSNCTVGGGAVVDTGTGAPAAKRSSTLRVAAGVRDGRRKPVPHGASVPSLPVVPGWKAMAAGGTERVHYRKRTRRRPPKRAGFAVGEGAENGGAGGVFDGARGGGNASWATGGYDGILKARNSSADLERLLSMSAGGRSGGGVPRTPDAADAGRQVRALPRNSSPIDENTGTEDHLDPNSDVPQRATPEVDEAEEETGESDGRERGSHQLAGDESLSMETLDSAFPVPEEGAEGGGGGDDGGLGETSAPGYSPGWSSRSSRRSSEASETASDALSDSAAIRHGKALLSGESPVGPAGGWGGSADDGVKSDAEEAGAAAAVAAVAAAAERGEKEHPALLSSAESGGTDAGDSERPPGGVLVQLPSSAFPDGVSDMSDNQTFIGQQQQQQQQQQRQQHDGEESGDKDERGGFGRVQLNLPYFGGESADVLTGGRLYTPDQHHGGGGL